jgi:stress-induced-phosphoprotein 1
MRDHTKAIEAIQEAKEHDVEHKHTSEISQQEMKCQQALFSQRGEETQEETLARAMRDPEVAVSHQQNPLFTSHERGVDIGLVTGNYE